MAALIDGNAISAQIRTELKSKVQELQEVYGVTPGLAVILVGSRTDSATYVRSKKKACAETGITSYGFDYPADVSQEELLAKVLELNAGRTVRSLSCSQL
jgi:5,10-methylene-tetrahydrofolate dehydrogenase/methenyl tetrahydrofolate cyclohydrolase